MKRHLLTVLSHSTHHSEPHSECSGSFTHARHIVGTQLMCANRLNAFQWLLHSHQSWLRKARFYCISTNIIEYKLCSRAGRQIDQEFHLFFHLFRSFPGGSVVKEYACQAGDMCSISRLGRYPGEGNTCSSILAWEILRTEEPDGIQSMELQRVGHD